MRDIKGIFKDWKITSYCAKYGGCELWIANGFLLFSDGSHEKAFLMGFNLYERWLLWRELNAEVKRRVLKF